MIIYDDSYDDYDNDNNNNNDNDNIISKRSTAVNISNTSLAWNQPPVLVVTWIRDRHHSPHYARHMDTFVKP